MSASLETTSLVYVNTPLVLMSMAPLVLIALASYSMDLKITSPILVGCFRTFFQLSILGLILRPIFEWGEANVWVVIAYVLLMVLVTSYESVARSNYTFDGIFFRIFISLLFNVTVVSLLAFCVIIRPEPVLWLPQYVIPIIGMLLGNSINGISISLNTLLTSMVEDSSELDLFLSFGANRVEATSRLIRESIRTGSMPIFNSMAMIGIVYIPGMMTGQIIAGAPVFEAAHYQMLIMYLIAMCTFGTILTEVFLVQRVGFDSEMPRFDRFVKRKEKRTVVDVLVDTVKWCLGRQQQSEEESESLLGPHVDAPSYVGSKGELEIRSLHASNGSIEKLQVCHLSRSFHVPSSTSKRSLFKDLSFSIGTGEIVLVSGPSGVGKSQLLRMIACLVPLEEEGGRMMLDGRAMHDLGNMALWRQRVRYVTQYKIGISGTPLDFIHRITTFQSWKHADSWTPASKGEMIGMCRDLLQNWGMDAKTSLESEWTFLSGGEAQRVIVAIALASRPQVLLMDESTSALDLDTKIRLEKSVAACVAKFGMSVLWITHDVDQVERMSRL